LAVFKRVDYSAAAPADAVFFVLRERAAFLRLAFLLAARAGMLADCDLLVLPLRKVAILSAVFTTFAGLVPGVRVASSIARSRIGGVIMMVSFGCG
jgi:hypothetical protein